VAVTGGYSGEGAVMFLKVSPPGAATFAPYVIVSGESNINFRLLDIIILQQKAKADVCAGTMSIYNILYIMARAYNNIYCICYRELGTWCTKKQ